MTWMLILTNTNIIFPIKYEDAGAGVPRKRLRVPSSRSIGIVIASCWNPVLTKPDAIMPATKYWLKVTPGAISSLKTEPKISNKRTGNNNVKTTDSRCLINCFTSRNPLLIPIFKVLGKLDWLILFHQSFQDKYPQDLVCLLKDPQSLHQYEHLTDLQNV